MSYTQRQIIDAFHQAVSATLEEMVFEQVNIVDDQEEIDRFEKSGAEDDSSGIIDSSLIWAEIDLIDPVAGILFIVMEQKYAGLICEALFGFGDDDPPEEIVRDAVAEMLNTIGGCFMKELIPPHREYQIGFPKTGIGSYEDSGGEALTVYFKIDNHIIKGIVCGEDFL